MMLRRINSWVLSCVLGVGVLLLMIGARPELQPTEHRDGRGPTVTIVGHALTWSTASVLTVRMVRATRRSLQREQLEREREFEAPARDGENV
jgi:hypothetical protein